MSLVVFMRGVNVGGYRTFRPSLLAGELAHLGVVNVGAAGTFIVTRPVPQAVVRAEFRARLPFETVLILCPGREIKDLVAADPYAGRRAGEGVRRFVSVLARRPRSVPRLPIHEPAGARWELKIIAVRGRFALSYWRRLRRGFLEPTGVVDERLGVTSTTRSWNTISKIHAMLDGLSGPRATGGV
jgi:uncharacterized protein (DUF1697 family)